MGEGGAVTVEAGEVTAVKDQYSSDNISEENSYRISGVITAVETQTFWGMYSVVISGQII